MNAKYDPTTVELKSLTPMANDLPCIDWDAPNFAKLVRLPTVPDSQISYRMLHISEIGEGMQAIVASTAVINDSISSLSATSQEVAARSNEGVNSSNSAVAQFTDFDKTLSGIYEQAEQLTKV